MPKNSTKPSSDGSLHDETSGVGAPKRIMYRFEVPEVLDEAITRYGESVGLSKHAAARSVLMRVFVKRDLRVPEPLNEQ